MYANYDMQPSILTKIFEIRILILNRLHKLIRRFRIKISNTGIVVSVNKRLSKIYLISEGWKSYINSAEFDIENAAKVHAEIKKGLSNFLHLHSMLEKANFFKNKNTQLLSERTLSNFYKIEAQLRFKSFAKETNFPGDKELTEFASNLSVGSLN